MKAAILQCDQVLDKFQSEFGDYPGMIERMFADAGYPDIDFETWDCRQQQYPSDPAAYDFFITTGSKEDAYGDTAWIHRLIAFVRDLDRKKIKLIGICFGHQIMALALGGQVEKSGKGWGVGLAHNRIITRPEWMRPAAEWLDLIVSHQDQITGLPGSGETVIAGSDFCPYFMLQWNPHFLSVQGHPEWRRDYACALLEDRRDRIDESLIEQALISLQQSPDNSRFTRWVMAFIGER
jgi:GMP synthase-like glutamine amidotransferase